MGKENGKEVLCKLKNWFTKRKIITTSILMVIILIVVIIYLFHIANKTNKSKVENLVTTEQIIEILKQSGHGDYLQEDSIKLGQVINFDYDKYNKMLSFSFIESNNNKVLKTGGLILLNRNTKENKYIYSDTSISSIIYSLNIDNNSSELKEIMGIIGEYFKENGIDEFNNANKNNTEKYMELGKNISKVIGVKQCRIIVDESIHMVASFTTSNFDEITLFYEPNNIFPKYGGCFTTEKEYAWNGTRDFGRCARFIRLFYI